MIDIVARRQAAEVLRHFLTGRITNEEFLKRYPASQDPVIWALANSMWSFYDDLEEHTLTGKNALPKELKADLSRWLLFLYSEEKYCWPEIGGPGIRRYLHHSWLSRISGFAKYVEKRSARFMDHGEYEVWPFISRQDFEKALKNPVLLGGHIQALAANSPGLR